SDEARLKISVKLKGLPSKLKGIKKPNFTGKNNPNWIKDRTKLRQSERKDKDTKYRYWRKEIRKRDRNECQLLSGDCCGRLESHHIFNWTDYPELRYELTNGITLCAFHHPRGR